MFAQKVMVRGYKICVVMVLGSWLATVAGLCESVPTVWLITNYTKREGPVPKNFRRADDNFRKTIDPKNPSTSDGLSSLRASGSAQFSEQQLQEMKKQLAKYKLIDVDLRQESHVFIDGKPYSWFTGENQINRGKTLEKIEQDEELLAIELGQKKETTIFKLGKAAKGELYRSGCDPSTVPIHSVLTEKQVCVANDVGYKRIGVADYHCPTPEECDEFVSFVKWLDKQGDEKIWLHFHCKAGRGRTTTFLAMYDMLRNASKVSFDGIVSRQRDLGGIDLVDPDTGAVWKEPYAKERTQFIKNFYAYCKQEGPNGFKEPYSKWIAHRRGTAHAAGSAPAIGAAISGD